MTKPRSAMLLDRSDEGWTGEELTLSISSHPPKVKVSVAQLGPTFCDPMDCSPPGSSVHGILQARTLEWVVIPFSWEFLVFLTQGSNPDLLRFRQILYHLSHQGSTVSPQHRLIPSEFVTLN